MLVKGIVHCRIGSLEIERASELGAPGVHCRIGSLETDIVVLELMLCGHCRIGSLEILSHDVVCHGFSSLPNRQLRNYMAVKTTSIASSLPNRQLRKRQCAWFAYRACSLPNRQLRNGTPIRP